MKPEDLFPFTFSKVAEIKIDKVICIVDTIHSKDGSTSLRINYSTGFINLLGEVK